MYPIIQIFGRPIGTYGLMMALGVIFVSCLSICRGRRCGLQMNDFLIVGSTALGFALVGGGAAYFLVSYSWKILWLQISSGNFRFFLNGGMVFYGGLIGGIPGAFLGVRLAGCSRREVEWAVVPFLPIGHSVGRIGCVFGGCCYGISYDGPFAIFYPDLDGGRFPVQILEALLDAGICAVLLSRSKRPRETSAILLEYLISYAALRFFLEFLRGDSVRGIIHGMSVSQWISLGVLVFCFLKLWICSKMKKYTLHKNSATNS